MSDFALNASLREKLGKGASRRLRREANQIPAILYGSKKEAMPLTLNHNEVIHALENEAFYSHILTLNIGDKSEKVIMKAIQRHPFKPKVTHIDFLRVSMTEAIRVQVPIHFTNDELSPGVKAGGVVSHQLTQVEVECLPGKLPEFIEVDIGGLEMDQALHLSDIKMPEGTVLVELAMHENNQAVVSVHIPKVYEEPEPEVEEGAEAAEGEEGAEGEAGAEGEKPAEGQSGDEKPKEGDK